MARLTGKDLTVLWADASGTIGIPTVREFDDQLMYSTLDYTGGEDVIRVHRLSKYSVMPTLRYIDYDDAINGVAGTALRLRLAPGKQGTLIWGEQGTASGKPRGAVVCRVVVNRAVVTYDSEMERELRFRATAGSLLANPSSDIF